MQRECIVSNNGRTFVRGRCACSFATLVALLLLSIRLSFLLCLLLLFGEIIGLSHDSFLGSKMVSKALFSLALLATGGLAKKDWVKGKAFDRIAIIWLENTDYDLAIGDPNLAALAKKGISLTNKFAVTHPSMPNYAAAVSGDYYGVNHDDMINIPSNVSTVVDLLEDKGISWGEYQEGKHGSYRTRISIDSKQTCPTPGTRDSTTATRRLARTCTCASTTQPCCTTLSRKSRRGWHISRT